MPRVIISDATCFILLQRIDRLDLLREVFGTVTTTPAVAAEVRFALPEWVLQSAPANHEKVHELQLRVDGGEASAIALALEISNSTLILDDLKARKLATKLGLEITGTAGVLLRAKKNGVITAVRPLIEAIQKTNFRFSDALVDETLRTAGEN